MSSIILLNNKTKVTFYEWPSFDEIRKILDSSPNLRVIAFSGVDIPDFSMLEVFNGYELVFDDVIIEGYSYPICLKGPSIWFINTRMNFEKFFFMTDMPNLKKLVLLYDSIEGVMQFKPYIHLLSFFPSLESLKLMMATKITYYDMDHKKEFYRGLFGENLSVLHKSKLQENLDFLNYMPNYSPKNFDGVLQIFNYNYALARFNKKLWVNPKFMSFYNGLRRDDLKSIKEFLSKLKQYGPYLRGEIGKSIVWLDFSSSPIYSYPNLEKVITERLRYRKLNSPIKCENEEPMESSLYGLFGTKLYDTKGHNILVNSRGSVIADYYEERTGTTKKLVNNLLPF